MTSKSRLALGDVIFGFVKGRKGEKVFDALKRQGREVREARREALQRAIKRGG